MESNCDFSPLKQNLEDGIKNIIDLLETNLNVLGNENYCVLGSLEDVKEHLIKIESMAASFYLNCYLSSFTDTYDELSIAAQILSKQKHGALIVVERRDSVDTIIQKGTTIGAHGNTKIIGIHFLSWKPIT